MHGEEYLINRPIIDIDNTIPITLDDSYLEKAIMRLFMLDIERLIQVKVSLAKQFHIQPSEIDKMPVWEYEMFMRILNEEIRAENEKQEKEYGKYKNIEKKLKHIDSPSQLSSALRSQQNNMNYPGSGQISKKI